MEQLYRLPNEYSEVTDNEPLNEVDGSDLDLQSVESFTDLDDSNAYKMIGEETPVAESDNTPITSTEVSGSNVAKLEENEEEVDKNNKPIPVETKIEQPQIDLSSLIKELDDKILDLETSLKVTTNNITNNDIEQQTTLRPENNNTEVVNSSFNTSNSNDGVENVKNIINQINELKNLKKTYENNLISSNKLTENIFNDSGIVRYDNFTNSVFENKKDDNVINENIFSENKSTVEKENNIVKNDNNIFNNFTPNLRIDPSDPNFDPENPKPWKKEKEKATELAVATEKEMGGDPIVEVVPGIGDVVIDESNQESFKDAVEQHGGIEDALSDSMSSQENFINNKNIDEKSFINQDNNDNNFYTSTVNNEEVSAPSQDGGLDNLPNYNADILKNSGDSLAILTTISKQLDIISKALGKNFNSLSNSLKDIKTTQQNNYYTANSTNASNNGMATATSNGSEPNIIPEIRGNKPLTEDFPKNFNMDNLFSNLRP